MVLEHLFPEDWLERRFRYAFLLAFFYSGLGILLARLLFPASSGIVSVFFTSLFLTPSLRRLLRREERRELKSRRFSLPLILRENREAILVYLSLFLGVYLAYLSFAFLLPQLGVPVTALFREQSAIEAGLRGGAFAKTTFLTILENNWWVLLATFLLALIIGDGALFFVVWNASSWGTIFALRALDAGAAAYGSWPNLFLLLLLTAPHVLLEGAAYILAAIAGAVISEDVVSRRGSMVPFLLWFLLGTIFFLFFLFLIAPLLPPFFRGSASLLIVLGGLRLLGFVFADRRHELVFTTNYVLFLFALFLFVVGALVETLVLSYAAPLRVIYLAV